MAAVSSLKPLSMAEICCCCLPAAAASMQSLAILPFLSFKFSHSSLPILSLRRKKLHLAPLKAQASDWARQEEEGQFKDEDFDWPAEEEEENGQQQGAKADLSEWEEEQLPGKENAGEGEAVAEGEGGFVEEAKLFVGKNPCNMDSENLAQLFDKAGVVETGHRSLQKAGRIAVRTPVCAFQKSSSPSVCKNYEHHRQNIDLPPVLPKKKKKPYPIPIQKMQRAARQDKKLAQMGIEKPLEPPKNGLLVPKLIPVAYEVIEYWKVLIKGLSQLMNVVTVYGCSKCSEIHVGPVGHQIQDCLGTGSEQRRSYHSWVRGSINDVLLPIESYHLFDPFGRRIKHEDRFNYDRIPAVIELCIQAGVELAEYPSRRRTSPIRMLGKKVIDRGGYVEEPKPQRSEDCIALLAELDTFEARHGEPPLSSSDTRTLAEKTLKAYSTVRRGVRQLMKKYTVKACGYCSEVHVGPWGHNAKLCGAFKHQWRDGKHGWQDAILDEVIPPNYVWHLRDPNGPPLKSALKRFYGKAPAVVEVCVQAGAEIPESYKPMMRLDIIVPDSEEAQLVA